MKILGLGIPEILIILGVFIVIGAIVVTIVVIRSRKNADSLTNSRRQTIFCPQCGAELNAAAHFCKKCGYKISH